MEDNKKKMISQLFSAIEQSPELISEFIRQAKDRRIEPKRQDRSRHQYTSKQANTSVVLSNSKNDDSLIDTKSQGQRYYYKFIQPYEKERLQNNLMSQNSNRYIPFEVGSKIPVKERVKYYMKKLSDEEEGMMKYGGAKNGKISMSIQDLNQTASIIHQSTVTTPANNFHSRRQPTTKPSTEGFSPMND